MFVSSFHHNCSLEAVVLPFESAEMATGALFSCKTFAETKGAGGVLPKSILSLGPVGAKPIRITRHTMRAKIAL